LHKLEEIHPKPNKKKKLTKKFMMKSKLDRRKLKQILKNLSQKKKILKPSEIQTTENSPVRN